MQEMSDGSPGNQRSDLMHDIPTRSDDETEAITIDTALERAGNFGRYQWRVLAATALLFQSFGFLALLPVVLLPRLQILWSLDEGQQALVGSTFFAGTILGQLVVGPLSDRFGRRRNQR
jgi:AAHS family benzoate transporter-like MFS transporter